MTIPADLLNTITTGDARLLSERIPDESVDLVFTDPVYDRIDDYRWLAETAARVLRPDSACLVWYDHLNFDAAYRAMVPPLNYAWLLYWQRYGHMAPGRAGLTVITPCLWLDKGRSKVRKPMADWCATTNDGLRAFRHDWAKPDTLIRKWVNAFTLLDAVVYDPFCGSGVVPSTCKQLGRNFIASEIDPATAERARERVAMTQEMHPAMLEAEQQSMAFEESA